MSGWGLIIALYIQLELDGTLTLTLKVSLNAAPKVNCRKNVRLSVKGRVVILQSTWLVILKAVKIKTLIFKFIEWTSFWHFQKWVFNWVFKDLGAIHDNLAMLKVEGSNSAIAVLFWEC